MDGACKAGLSLQAERVCGLLRLIAVKTLALKKRLKLSRCTDGGILADVCGLQTDDNAEEIMQLPSSR